MPRHIGSKIVRDGLVMYLDAANKSSYPGSGDIWYDLTSYGNNATIVGSPTYSTNNMGYFTLNGSGQYFSILDSTSLHGDTATYSIFIKTNSNTDMGVFEKQGTIVMNISYPNTAGLTVIYLPAGIEAFGTTFPYGRWTYFSFVYSTNGVTSYYDNIMSYNDSYIRGNLSYNSNNLSVGTCNGLPYINGNIASVKVYNRALSQAEVSQNFNALRRRYGV